MSNLATQQSALLEALFAWPAKDAIKKVAAYAIDTGHRGLKAYQANGHAMAETALSAAYPVLAQLLSEDSFADLARALWHAYPPERGDLGRWGEHLPAFVAASAQLNDDPYLSDVARLEWCLHKCSTAADAVSQPDSLALLTQQDPDDLTLRLAPGCEVVRSPWPIVSIVLAHLEGTPHFAEVGDMLRAQVGQDAVVWREGLKPCTRLAWPGEPEVLQALVHGASLGQALGADVDGALDFAAWFPHAIQTGLVLGVAPQSPTPS